jgi:hypothetical protein
MKVTYGYVFLIEIATICLTAALSILYFKKVRDLWFGLMEYFGIRQGRIFKLLFWLTFLIIVTILVDSINTYYVMKEEIRSNVVVRV